MTIKQQGGIFGRNPTFNNVDVEGTLTVNGEPISDFGTMAQQDANNVNIDGGAIDGTTLGENTRSTGKFTTANTSSYLTVESSAGSGLRMYGSSGTNQWDVYLNSTNLRFSDNTGGGVAQFDTNINLNNSNLVIGTSGKGIDFSATSGTGTSELFNDYEEGTYNPSLYGNTTGPGTTLPLSSSYNTLAYTKIGRQVTITGKLETSGSHSASGYLRLTVPFVGADLSDSAGTATGSVFFYRTGQLHTNPSVITGEGTSTVIFYENTAGGDVTTINAEDMDAAIEVFFGFTYFTT